MGADVHLKDRVFVTLLFTMLIKKKNYMMINILLNM